MKLEYDIKDTKEIKRLKKSNKFIEYPNMFLNNTCNVRVNNDAYLLEDDFTIYCKSKILPKKIYIYGKRTTNQEEDNLYLNYWMSIFLKTVENGKLCKNDFKKSNSKTELTIGIPLKLRYEAYNFFSWNRENIIEFLSCLFNIQIEETNYEQQDIQDIIDQMRVA